MVKRLFFVLLIDDHGDYILRDCFDNTQDNKMSIFKQGGTTDFT